MKLTAQNVERLFAECLRDAGEPTEGVMGSATLDTTGRESDIESMLAQLPAEFQTTGGGGWSFLNACMDKGGGQWTGMHPTMDKLFMLGIAAGKARFLLPREMWGALPGGMPYVAVN